MGFPGMSLHRRRDENRRGGGEEDRNQGTNDGAHALHAMAVRRKGMGWIPSMPVSDSTSVAPTPNAEQRKAAAALLRSLTPAAAELGELFARAGHELALVGGSVRDAFLGGPPGDLDLTTDAVPQRVLEITGEWADKTWTVGIDFGTVGLRKGEVVFEITTYRSEQYGPRSRKPDVRYGRSLEEDLARRDFTINAMAARLPSYELVDP